jgi:O-antigen/teichoic acid export membrane protein
MASDVKELETPQRVGPNPLLLSFLASAVIQGMNVATGAMLAHSLGPTARGELAALILWPNVLAALGSLGVAEALTYYLARANHPSERLIQSSLGLCLLQSTVLAAIGYLAVPLALARYDAHIMSLARLYIVFIPLNLCAMYLMAALNGFQRYVSYQWLRLLNVGSTVVGLAYLVLAGRLTVGTAAVVYLIAWLITATVTSVTLRSRFSVKWPESAHARRLLSFGIKSHSGFVSSVLNEWLDKLLMAIFLGPASLGLYVVATTLTSVTSLVGSSASLVALPLIAGTQDEHYRAKKICRLVQVTLAASVIVTIPLYIFLPDIIEIAFGSQFSSSLEPGRTRLVGAVFLSVNRVLSSNFRAIGRPLDAGIGESIALALTVIGLMLFLQRFNLIGAATISLTAYLISMIWMVRRAGRVLGLSSMQILIPDRHEVLSLMQIGRTLITARSGGRRT